jgi:hypothetical protein
MLHGLEAIVFLMLCIEILILKRKNIIRLKMTLLTSLETNFYGQVEKTTNLNFIQYLSSNLIQKLFVLFSLFFFN